MDSQDCLRKCASINARFSLAMLQDVASPSRACLPEVSEGCAASPLKSVDQAGTCGEHTSFSSREFQSRACSGVYKPSHLRVVPSMLLLYLHKPFPSQEFRECACGECTGLLVSRCCRLALVITPSFVSRTVRQACTWGSYAKLPVARMFPVALEWRDRTCFRFHW